MGGNEIGSFVVDIKTKIEGYQAQIEQVRKALSQVGANSNIGKSLAKELASVEKQVDSLSRRMSQRISSDAQIVKLTDSLNNVDSAFLNIGETIKRVNFSDLDTQYISSELQALNSELTTLQTKLNTNLNLNFSSAITGSEKIQDLLKTLDINPSTINIDNWKSVLQGALDDSKEKAQELRDEIADLVKQQKALRDEAKSLEKGTPQAGDSEKFVKSLTKGIDVNSILGLSEQTITQFKDGINAAISVYKPSDEVKQQVQAQVAEIFNTTNTTELQNNLNHLVDNLLNTLKGRVADKVTKAGLGRVLGSELSKSFDNINAQNIGKLQVSFFQEVNQSSIELLRTRLEGLLETVKSFGLEAPQAEAFIRQVLGQFSNNHPEAAIKLINEQFDAYIEKNKQLAETSREGATALQSTIDDRKGALQEQNAATNRINGTIVALTAKCTQLEKDNAQLKAQIADLTKRIADQGTAAVDNVRDTGQTISDEAARQLQENARLSQNYQDQLDKVKEKEKLVGKLEGVAQRWFSIYAAVRMVRQAIDSVIATIKELDETITEIAIVTDMTQKELWGQMSAYTDMARQYATSISGVYKVSQLFYQQGGLNI